MLLRIMIVRMTMVLMLMLMLMLMLSRMLPFYYYSLTKSSLYGFLLVFYIAEHIVNNLAEAACDDEATSVVEELEQLFMFGEVKFKEDPMQRLQHVLELLKEQRDLHIARLLNRHDPRFSAGQPDFTFTDQDMKEVMNTWRKDLRK